MREDLEGIRQVLCEVAGALDEFAPRDAAELELLALNLIGPFAHPGLPEEAVALLPEALAARGDELAAGILAALAELAPEPLCTDAAHTRERLAAGGVVSPLSEGVGMLEVCECYRVSVVEGAAEMLGALLVRPGSLKPQASVLFLEHEPCGAVVVRGLLTGPEKPAAARKLIRTPHPDTTAEPIEPAELRRLVAGALEHMVEHDLELSTDVLAPLLVLQRALGGDWPRPPLGQSEDVQEALRADGEALADAFAAEYGDEAAGVTDEMCHWKVDYVGGLVGRWTVADLEEFLLEWYPRKGSAGELELVADRVIAFLRFLDDEGRLAGDDLESLIATVERLREPFERAASDRRNWGPAKALVMQMRAEGVDPMEPGALDEWMAKFNARPLEERDNVLAPSLPRPAPRTTQRRKAQRRSTKAARKRNRR